MLKVKRITDWQRGFTLVEMMVVVAIMAILLGVAAPSFQTFVANARIRAAAENIQAGLMLAKGEALRRNENITFWLVNNLAANCALSGAGTTWVVSANSPAGACNSAPSDTASPRLVQTGSPLSDAQNITVGALSGDSTPVAASCVTFNGFGRLTSTCTNSASRIVRVSVSATNQSTGTRSLDVRIDNGGGVRVCDPAKTGIAGC